MATAHDPKPVFTYSNGAITVWKYAFSSLGVACILFLRTHHWTISTKLPEM